MSLSNQPQDQKTLRQPAWLGQDNWPLIYAGWSKIFCFEQLLQPNFEAVQSKEITE